jgi:hypothetical protein
MRIDLTPAPGFYPPLDSYLTANPRMLVWRKTARRLDGVWFKHLRRFTILLSAKMALGPPPGSQNPSQVLLGSRMLYILKRTPGTLWATSARQ